MLVDLRSLEEGAILDADLCVVGAGAAGITLARAFAGRTLRVCLVESGGLEPDAATQDLYRGSSVGVNGFPLHVSRLRYLGGTTNHWNGWCAPLAEADFTVRSWIPHSGWPLAPADLAPHYERAAALLGLGADAFAPEGGQPPPPALDPERLVLSAWRIDEPPTRFGPAFRNELEVAANVTVLLHANVVRVARSPEQARVSHVELAALGGRRARVRAGLFVLACGGLENARLLLVSNDVEPAGLGNGHGLVGRFYMDHFHLELGRIHAPGEALRGLRRQGGAVPRHGGLRLCDRVQREEAVGNPVAWIGQPRSTDPPAEAAQEAPGLADRVARMLDALFGTQDGATAAPGAAAASPADPAPRDVLHAYGNPRPDPESRVRLGEERDALGLPRLVLDWRLSDDDGRSLTVLAHTVGVELARLGAGRLRLAAWLREGGEAHGAWRERLLGANHPTGTTRMAADPRRGVTDPDGRIHGLENLYVAGSSLFPTAGWGNPTLTILALTFRLAEHLGRRLGVSPVVAGG